MTNGNWTNSSSKSPVDYPMYVFCFLVIVFCVRLIGDCLIVIIINKTPMLKSYTGRLLTSQILSDIGLCIVSCTLIFPGLLSKKDMIGDLGRTLLANIGCAFHGITSQTLVASSLNLYFAICHSTSYRQRMSVKHVRIFIPVCWIFNIILCMTPLIPEVTRASMYILPIDNVVLLPNYNPQTLWAWLMIVVNAYAIPAIVTGYAFLKIRMFSQKIQPITHANYHYRDKYQLSQITTGISVCYIGMWSLLHIFRTLQAKFEINKQERGVFQTLSLVTYLVNLAYDTLKVGIYTWTYRPIRNTVTHMFKGSEASSTMAIVVQERRTA